MKWIVVPASGFGSIIVACAVSINWTAWPITPPGDCGRAPKSTSEHATISNSAVKRSIFFITFFFEGGV